MGLIHTDLKLTNLFTEQSVNIRAMVDTGAMHMCVTAEIARQLGFDVEEMPRVLVRVADGRHVKVPSIAPIRIEFSNRSYTTEALVLGEEPLVGVLPLEAMDLVVDPVQQQIMVNPLHPNFPVFPVK